MDMDKATRPKAEDFLPGESICRVEITSYGTVEVTWGAVQKHTRYYVFVDATERWEFGQFRFDRGQYVDWHRSAHAAVYALRDRLLADLRVADGWLDDRPYGVDHGE